MLVSQLVTACAPPPTVLPAPVPEGDQRLQAGDVLRIDVWRQPEYSGEFQIGVDGRLLHPLYQDFQLAGLPVSRAREEVGQYLEGYLQGARFVVEPLYRVAVGGEVRQPAVLQVPRGTTIADVVAQAGGPTVLAKLDEVLLVRSGTQHPLRLGETLATFGGVPIVSGDQVLVERKSTFNVWRDVIGPVATLSALVLSIVRIEDITSNNP
jgi:polysaccharide export outer membrane protein